MKQTLTLLFVLALLLITAHRLPAPIEETPESPTPAATTAPEEPAKPKPKRTTKPKPKSNESEQAASPAKQQSSAKRSRFAGAWVGTMPTVPWGNLPSVVVIDSTETLMAMSWYEADEPGTGIHQHFKAAPESARGQIPANPAFARARLQGGTMIASFPAPLLGKSTWSITPQPDGVTAKMRMQAFFNDFSAIFQRQSGSSSFTAPVSTAPMTTTPQKSEIPTAKPVPDRPGFVYNPFSPNSKMLLDVRGKTSGTKVKDPTSGKLFIVP